MLDGMTSQEMIVAGISAAIGLVLLYLVASRGRTIAGAQFARLLLILPLAVGGVMAFGAYYTNLIGYGPALFVYKDVAWLDALLWPLFSAVLGLCVGRVLGVAFGSRQA